MDEILQFLRDLNQINNREFTLTRHAIRKRRIDGMV